MDRVDEHKHDGKGDFRAIAGSTHAAWQSDQRHDGRIQAEAIPSSHSGASGGSSMRMRYLFTL